MRYACMLQGWCTCWSSCGACGRRMRLQPRSRPHKSGRCTGRAARSTPCSAPSSPPGCCGCAAGGGPRCWRSFYFKHYITILSFLVSFFLVRVLISLERTK